MKKWLCVFLLLLSPMSIANNDEFDQEEYCDEMYHSFVSNIYDNFLLKVISEKKNLSVKTDQEAAIKMLNLMQSNPQFLKEFSYSMGGNENEAQFLFSVMSYFLENTESVFYSSNGKLKSPKEVEAFWGYQCYMGKLEPLFEYLDSIEEKLLGDSYYN